MNTSVRAPGYNAFKLTVAIILLILFSVLLWRGNLQSPIPTIAPLITTETASIASTVATFITPTQASATVVPKFSPTATPTPTPSPSATMVSTSSPTSTPIPSLLPTVAACDAATSRSRLQIGGNATILRRLNFRSSPGIQNNWLLTNRPGTKVEVIGGPVCLPYYAGAYVWWQIKLPDGRIGWSAESSVLGAFYFMEPTP